MKRIYDFSSFSSINEDNTAPGETGNAESAKWEPSLNAILSGIVGAFTSITQLASPKKPYEGIINDLKSVEDAKTLDEKITALGNILNNASKSIDSEYPELKEVGDKWTETGKKYISGLSKLKETLKDKTSDLEEINSAITKYMNEKPKSLKKVKEETDKIQP
jgi:vacuolar-type H+-ATPase subunit I/STV1